MTHVVAEPCVNCRYTDCVEVCPVDAFRAGENCLVIDPRECIDCTLCVSQCPVGAIFADGDLPERWSEWLALNDRLSTRWPIIRKKIAPLSGHENAARLLEKRELLSERPEHGL
ncbi:MAG: ferredoxin family protein [Planctomycetota bacterium]